MTLFETLILEASRQRAVQDRLTGSWLAAVGHICGLGIQKQIADEYPDHVAGVLKGAVAAAVTRSALLPWIAGPFGVAAGVATIGIASALKSRANQKELATLREALQEARSRVEEIQAVDPDGTSSPRGLASIVADLVRAPE